MYSLWLFILSLSFNSICLGLKSFNENNLPVIIWWTEMLFPHIEDVTEVTGNLGRCISCKKRRYSQKQRPTAYLFYGSDFSPEILPLPRSITDVWALFHEESPLNNYILSHTPGISLFNYTATFSRHSDFPVTTQFIKTIDYVTERKPMSLEEKNYHRKNGIAPVMYLQSHCNVPSDRDTYVRELMKYIQIDSYGQCLHNKDLPDSLNTTETYSDEKLNDYISKYKFHIAFENALCDDYITEKLYRPLYVGSVPIYKGAPTVKDWLPNDQSAILVDDFSSPKDLAAFILKLDENDDLYAQYLTFKENGVTNEHLKQAVLGRNWGINDPNQLDFIQAFECYVCDRMHELNETFVPSFGKKKHMNCHQPHPSFINEENVNKIGEDLEEWIENYWFSYDIANAAQMMIQNRDTNTSKYHKYLMKQRYKK